MQLDSATKACLDKLWHCVKLIEKNFHQIRICPHNSINFRGFIMKIFVLNFDNSQLDLPHSKLYNLSFDEFQSYDNRWIYIHSYNNVINLPDGGKDLM